MKKLIAVFLITVMLLSLGACGGAEQPQSIAEDTVSTIEESTGMEETVASEEPVAPVVPETTMEPVEEVQLPSDYTVEIPVYELVERNYTYKSRENNSTFSDFIIDDQGQMMSWVEGGNGSPGTYSYEYDEMGNVVKSVFDSNYGDIRTYEYDDVGRMTGQTIVDINDESDYSVYEYVYDENGLEIGYTRIDSDEPDTPVVYEADYEFGEDGTIVAWKEVDTSDGSFDYSQYEYNDKGLVSKYSMVTDWADGDVDAYSHECTYNELGYLEETKSLYENDNYEYTTTYTYAEIGRVTMSTMDGGMFQKTDNWTYLDEARLLPTPSSVFAGVADGDGGVFAIEASDELFYEYYDAFTTAMNKRTHFTLTVKSPVYDYYFGYLAVLQQVLGLNVSVDGNGASVLKGSSVIATVTTGYRADSGYYIQIDES